MVEKCTAKSKQSQQRCKNYPAKGRTTCRFHGGKSLVGRASPKFKTGEHTNYMDAAVSKILEKSKYGDYLEDGIANKYRESLSDEELLSLRDDIAVLDAFEKDLMSQVDLDNSFDVLMLIQSALKDYEKANKISDDFRREHSKDATVNKLEKDIDKELKNHSIRAEIIKVQTSKRQAVDSERKWAIQLGTLFTAQQGLALVSSMVDIIAKHVSDRKTLSAIQHEIGMVAGTIVA